MFRTALHISPCEHKIALDTPVMSIGSCFSTCIGEKLVANKFKALVNPFGTVFNPLSIYKLLQYAIEKDMPEESSYLEDKGLAHNYYFHSSFYGTSKENLATKIEKALFTTHDFLKSAAWLTITPGTAFVYTLISNQRVVSNCHKRPSTLFEKRLLTSKEIVTGFDHFYNTIKAINPAVKFILTVSPVRHIKDTIALNSVSKSVLRVACNDLAQQYDDVDYFPSYEIMMDDLRDYRFYKADMIHPTEVAEDYIWEKFSQRYFDSDTVAFLKVWQKIKNALSHKPFIPGSQAHQQFVSETIRQLKALSHQVDVNEEIALLKKQWT